MHFRKMIVSLFMASMLALTGAAGMVAQDGSGTGGGGSPEEVPVKVEVGQPSDAGIHWTIVESAPWAVVESKLDREQSAKGTLTVTVTDNRFTQAGWALSISADNFLGERTENEIPIGNFSVSPGPVRALAGDEDPLPVANEVTMSSDPQVLFAADPGSGSGRYSVTLTGAIVIPANTLADVYGTTVEISLNAAP